MEANKVYSASLTGTYPSVVELPKPQVKPELTGLLKAFKYFNGLVITLTLAATLMLLGMALAEFVNGNAFYTYIAYASQILPWLFLAFAVFQLIGKQDEQTPDLITKYFAFFAGAAFIIYGAVYYFASIGVVSAKPISLVYCLVYYLFWVNYFQMATSVRRYFGRNATP